jgi:hypothetical protein
MYRAKTSFIGNLTTDNSQEELPGNGGMHKVIISGNFYSLWRAPKIDVYKYSNDALLVEDAESILTVDMQDGRIEINGLINLALPLTNNDAFYFVLSRTLGNGADNQPEAPYMAQTINLKLYPIMWQDPAQTIPMP